MTVRKACEIGTYGAWCSMPASAADWSIDQKTAWAVGVFSSCAEGSDVEIKHINIDSAGKTYERLEIHDESAQAYAVVRGSVAVPVSDKLEASSLKFIEVNSGEAIVVDKKIWHAGAVGINVPASVIIVLRKGTTADDTLKKPLDEPVKFPPCDQ